MGFSVSYNFIAKDKFSAVTKAMKKGIDRISAAAKKAGRQNRRLAVSAIALGRSFKATGDKMFGTGKKLFTRVTLPIVALGTAVLLAAGKIEKIETAFIGMLGSVEKAKAVVRDLTEFTAKTPFQLGDVAGAATQLLAAGVTVKNMQNRLRTLGDIAAAANVPLKDMAAIFAKAKNKGKAMTEELLQLSDRGIPIIDVLSRGLGVTKNKVFELASKSKISFAILLKAFRQMGKTGEFANRAMVLQSKTLFGIISTLKDNIVLAAAVIGDIFLPMAKKFALLAITAAAAVKGWALRNKGLVKVIGIVLSILALVGPVMIGIATAILSAAFTMKIFTFAIGLMSKNSLVIIIATKAWAAATWILAAAMKGASIAFAFLMSPVGLTIAAITGLIFLVLKFTGVWDKMVAKIKDVGPLQAVKDVFESIKNAVRDTIDKVKNFLGFGSDINVTSRQELSSNAVKPVGAAGAQGSFQGNMNIAIADKGKNVESVNFEGFGDLDLGVSGVGI